MALFDALASHYDDWYRTPLGAYVDRVERELVLHLARPRPGEAAVDLGCGTGQYALDLAARGLSVTGVDISPAMLAVARRKAGGAGLPVHWVEADVRAVPLPDASFDLAVAVTVLEFLPDPERAVAEALRLVRPGGRLVVAVLGEGSAWARLYRQEAGQNPASVFSQARFFTAESLARLLGVRPLEVRAALYIDPEEARELLESPAEPVATAALAPGGPSLAARWACLDAAARARGALPGFLAGVRFR